MQIDILTLFPEMFKGPFDESMVRIAKEKGLINITLHNLRRWTSDKHRSVDDRPFGGGRGMLLKVEPIYKALCELTRQKELRKGHVHTDMTDKRSKIVLLTPQGKKLNQRTVKRISKLERVILVCGHYEGIDERIRLIVDEEISIGDYILTCGELPACVFVDAVTRLIPGVLGAPECLRSETFEAELLEYPQYTRPRVFKNMRVPEVLLSGNHRDISTWRQKKSLSKTKERRPDLYKKQR